MEQMSSTETNDVVVVGGGLAGLTAAVVARNAGRRVTVLEARSEVGGRARTADRQGYLLNEGPHALYCDGEALPILRSLGVEPEGSPPPTAGAMGLREGNLELLPAGPVALARTTLLGARAKVRIGLLLASLPKVDPAPLAGTNMAAWVEQAVPTPEERALLHALVRISTYSNDPDHLSADAGVLQVQRALAGSVLYLHGGWRTLVDQLRDRALRAGVRIVTGAKVRQISPPSGATGWALRVDGDVVAGSIVVAAGGPHALASLLDGTAAGAVAATWAAAARPCTVAALDVGLAGPWDAPTLVLGIDQPVYLSVHAPTARLAPRGATLVSMAKYLRPGERTNAEADRAELEAVLDGVEPGWRARCVEQRFLHRAVATHDNPRVAAGGLPGRPGPDVAGVPGLFVAGDWVGPKGLLADAALASAVRAAECAVQVTEAVAV